jgi:biopolymer transport protein ExbD
MSIGIKSLISTRRSAPTQAPSPPLTSLCDMMTILVVFLLVNFSVEGELFTPDPDVRLPVSNSRLRAQPTVSVEVTAGGISLDGTPVATLDVAMAGTDLLIAPLQEALSRRLREVAKGTQGSPEAPRPLTIQCDRNLDFRVIKRVVHTCSQAGGSDFALLVRREEP